MYHRSDRQLSKSIARSCSRAVESEQDRLKPLVLAAQVAKNQRQDLMRSAEVVAVLKDQVKRGEVHPMI